MEHFSFFYLYEFLFFRLLLHKPHHHQLVAHHISDHDPDDPCKKRNPCSKPDGPDQFTRDSGINGHLKDLPKCHGLVPGPHI